LRWRLRPRGFSQPEKKRDDDRTGNDIDRQRSGRALDKDYALEKTGRRMKNNAAPNDGANTCGVREAGAQPGNSGDRELRCGEQVAEDVFVRTKLDVDGRRDSGGPKNKNDTRRGGNQRVSDEHSTQYEPRIRFARGSH
jgi:hypothetical protein